VLACASFFETSESERRTHALTLVFFRKQPETPRVSCQRLGSVPTNPTSAYVVNGNGTVTDSRTGLMWKVCSQGQVWVPPSATAASPSCSGTTSTFNWSGALAEAASSNTTFPKINEEVFPNTQPNLFVSSSITPRGGTGSVMRLNLSNGTLDAGSRSNFQRVRLVRAGF
jgi:Protein of unknown function (DUF1566)